MLALAALVFALWQTPVALPLKLLVVLFHELAHGLAALATGGSIESLTVTADQGGLAVTRGGSRFAILTRGLPRLAAARARRLRRGAALDGRPGGAGPARGACS